MKREEVHRIYGFLKGEIMNRMSEIAKLLGVELFEEFTIRASEDGKILGCKVDEETIYSFDFELVSKGYDDGWSKWYGTNPKIFYNLCIGLYEIVKIKKEEKDER